MERELAGAADKTISGEPDRPARIAVASQQRVCASLQEDIANGQHLLCVSGPAGSGKTALLRALSEACDQGLTILIRDPKPGALLRNILTALKLGTTDGNPVAGRRRLAIRLTMAEQHKRPIIVMVDAAHELLREDVDLLFHFFPPGHATVVLAGEGDPERWPAGCTAEGEGARPACIYFLEPLSPAETEDYVRQRLHASALPRELFDAAAVSDIHRRSGGLPGEIDRICASLLRHAAAAGSSRRTQAAEQDNDLTAPTFAPTPDREPELEPVAAAMVEPIAPAINRQQRAMQAALSVTRRAADALTAAHEQIRDRQRLERSARRWRAATIALSVALIAIIAVILLGPYPLRTERAALEYGLATSPGARAPAESPSSALTPADADPGATVEAPPITAGVRADSAGPAQATDPEPPPVSDRSTAATSGPDAAAPSAADAAAPLEEPPIDAELPATAASTDAEADIASAPGAAASGARDFRTRATEAAESAPRDPSSTPTTAAISGAASAPDETRSEPASSAMIGRLYAERAEYEWRSGRLGAAAISIDRGLAADPRNRRLLELRAVLRSAGSPGAPPMPTQP